jgi:poly(A) polymerase
MVRGIALAARLGFEIDRDTVEAIHALRGEIVRSSPARILEELYKILRQGASRATFEALHRHGLLAYLLPQADAALSRQPESLLGSLARLDGYRNAGMGSPEELTNPLLMGTLLVPLGVPLRRVPRGSSRRGAGEDPAEPEAEVVRDDVPAELEALGADEAADPAALPALPAFLDLPFARRDLDRLRLVLAAQNRLREVRTSPRVKQLLAGRSYLDDALRWMEIHGGVQGQELAAHWRGLGGAAEAATDGTAGEPLTALPGEEDGADGAAPRRRRRRRRHRRRPRSTPPMPPTA